MGKVTKREMPMWAKTGHAKPVSRRDFLAAGLIPFAASALVPGALGLFSSPFALAETTCAAPSGVLPTFVTVNLSGGAGLAANFIPRDQGGQLLTSYSRIGGGTAANIALAPEMAVGGMQPFAAASGLLAGLKTGAPTALARTSVVGMCVQSRDDTADNPYDASGMVYKAGLVGTMLPNMGTTNTTTGISQQPAVVSPPSPLVVDSVTDLANSIGYTATLNSSLNVDQKQKVARLVASLSSSQASKLLSTSNVAPVKNLIDCAGIRNTDLVKAGAAAIDPVVQAPALANAWGVNAGTAKNNQNYVFAAMVYNSLVGNGGVVNIQLGGYDYHDGTRTTGDNRDNQAGQVIGRILESAQVLNKKIFVYVTSDGATTSNDSATPGSSWVSDRGTGGLALMFMFDPSGAPAVSGNQIGYFTSGQVAADSTVIGNDPAKAAQAAFANYMSFSKRMDLFSKVISGNSGIAASLDQVLKI